IVPVEPFPGDPAVAEFLESLGDAARELGCADCLAPVASASTPARRAALINRLRETKTKTVVICPEDHVAIRLLDAACAGGLSCPGHIGILSVMGTHLASEAGLSCVRYDFRAIGRAALQALDDGRSHVFPPQFLSGSST